MNARRSLVFVLAAAAAAGLGRSQSPRWFDAPVQFETMQGEFALLGDVDGDGDVDAISFATQPSFTVWRNDGAGNFAQGATRSLPADAGTHVDLADVDGDGLPDVLVTTLTTSPLGAGILIHLGQPGGTFGAAQHLPLPGNVLILRHGNGNGDAAQDLLVRYFDGPAAPTRWLFGAAGGLPSFGPSIALPITFDFRTFDANGDGLDDFVFPETVTLAPGILHVYTTTPTGFAPFGTAPLAESFGTDICLIDVDGDDDLDVLGLAGAAANSTALTVVTNLGGGSWSSAIQYLAGLTAGGLFPGDWDGDGFDDLMLRGYTGSSGFPPSHRLQRLRNLGDGTFGLVDAIPVRDVSSGYGAGLADLDGDGRLDWLDSKAVWFGNGTLAPLFGTTNLNNVSDWDGDGDLDLRTGNWLLNDGNGVFTERVLVWPSLGSGVVAAGTSVTADFDGDGLRETTFAAQQYQFPFPFPPVFLGTFLFHETADFTFVDGGLATPPPGRIDGGVATDSDGDGDLDIVDATGIWVNDGTGSFTRLTIGGGGYRPVTQADVDGDGDMDLLATTTGGGTSVAVLYRTGPNAYTTTVLFPSTTSSILNLVPQFADVDGDGLSDLVLCGEQLRVQRRTGPGPVYADAVVFAAANMRHLVDFDQDGDLDAVGYGWCENRRFEPPSAGSRRQYGEGSVGVGGRAPLLSVVGPVRGGETPSIRLRNAPGGTFALLIVGSGETNAPSVFLPGVQSYVFPIDLLLGYTLAGAGLQPAVGGIDIPVAIPNGLAGASLFLEFVVLDPSLPGAFTNSNGCEFVIGG